MIAFFQKICSRFLLDAFEFFRYNKYKFAKGAKTMAFFVWFNQNNNNNLKGSAAVFFSSRLPALWGPAGRP